MTVYVKTQDEIPAALYSLEPGFTGVAINKTDKGIRIDVEYP